jgi:hypothetical protein
MSSSAYNFFGAEHTITIGEQLNAGARVLMLDAYYGYDDDGLVRTNLAGGVDKKQVRAESGEDAVRELDRLGALTGAADLSRKKQDVYFCHGYCELGAVKASDALGEVRDFLDRNLTDVVILDFEDYVQPKDIKRALVDAGIFDRVYRRKPNATGWPSLHEMIVPEDSDADESRRRLIVMSEKHPDPPPWLISTYSVSEETPFSFKSPKDFNCKPARGKTGKDFMIVNHWVDSGAPDPTQADSINSTKTLTRRLEQCITERGKLPNFVAVNFYGVGDLERVVQRFNAAVARRTGVSGSVSRAIRAKRDSATLTRAELQDLNALHRLPRISDEQARQLLGRIAESLPPPRSLDRIVEPEYQTPPPTTTAPPPPPEASEP